MNLILESILSKQFNSHLEIGDLIREEAKGEIGSRQVTLSYNAIIRILQNCRAHVINKNFAVKINKK